MKNDEEACCGGEGNYYLLVELFAAGFAVVFFGCPFLFHDFRHCAAGCWRSDVVVGRVKKMTVLLTNSSALQEYYSTIR